MLVLSLSGQRVNITNKLVGRDCTSAISLPGQMACASPLQIKYYNMTLKHRDTRSNVWPTMDCVQSIRIVFVFQNQYSVGQNHASIMTTIKTILLCSVNNIISLVLVFSMLVTTFKIFSKCIIEFKVLIMFIHFF